MISSANSRWRSPRTTAWSFAGRSETYASNSAAVSFSSPTWRMTLFGSTLAGWVAAAATAPGCVAAAGTAAEPVAGAAAGAVGAGAERGAGADWARSSCVNAGRETAAVTPATSQRAIR